MLKKKVGGFCQWSILEKYKQALLFTVGMEDHSSVIRI